MVRFRGHTELYVGGFWSKASFQKKTFFPVGADLWKRFFRCKEYEIPRTECTSMSTDVFINILRQKTLSPYVKPKQNFYPWRINNIRSKNNTIATLTVIVKTPTPPYKPWPFVPANRCVIEWTQVRTGCTTNVMLCPSKAKFFGVLLSGLFTVGWNAGVVSRSTELYESLSDSYSPIGSKHLSESRIHQWVQ